MAFNLSTAHLFVDYGTITTEKQECSRLWTITTKEERCWVTSQSVVYQNVGVGRRGRKQSPEWEWCVYICEKRCQDATNRHQQPTVELWPARAREPPTPHTVDVSTPTDSLLLLLSELWWKEATSQTHQKGQQEDHIKIMILKCETHLQSKAQSRSNGCVCISGNHLQLIVVLCHARTTKFSCPNPRATTTTKINK